MIKILIFWFAFIFFSVGPVIVYSVPANQNKADEIDSLLKDEQSELQILRKKIVRQERAISKAGAKESAVLKNLQKIGNQLKLKERELNIYQWNFKNTQKKISSLEKMLKKAEQKIEYHKNILGLRIRSIYKEGSLFPFKIIFSSSNVTDLLQNIKYMELLARHDSELVHGYKKQAVKIKQDRRSLYEVKAKLVNLKKYTINKKKEIERTKNEKAVFLKKIKKKKSLNEIARKELVAASDKLNKIIDKLLLKLVSGEGLDISDKKGRLKLPLRGRILNKFGRKRVKEYDSYIVYNGINVRAKKGSSVKAIFDGKVLYAGELEGYGNLVIIGHGKKYHSLYGHLDYIKVRPDNVVRTGDTIALSGDSGSLDGESLYFELRKDGKPVEPITWFKITKR